MLAFSPHSRAALSFTVLSYVTKTEKRKKVSKRVKERKDERKRDGEKNDRGSPRIYSADRDETANAFDRKQRRPMETTTRGQLIRCAVKRTKEKDGGRCGG